MKLIIFFFLITFFLLAHSVSALIVKIEIKENLEAVFLGIPFNETYKELPNVIVDLFNTGSVPYTARLRLDIYKENENIFTAWSDERTFLAGDKDFFNLYWFVNETGNYTARLRSYYGNEILQTENFTLGFVRKETRDVFDIKDFKTFGDRVTFKINSNESTENVVVFPSKIPLGWIFEQKKIGKVEIGKLKEVSLPYKPSYFSERNIVINVASENGELFSQKTFKMVKEKTLREKFLEFFSKLLQRK